VSDQEYTTAVIVAVPAADDPVHAVVAEDAHVTLFFLGEAAELPDADIEEIRDSLELLANQLHTFPAKISGTAELGEDAAKVLLIESAPLTKIRELIETIPAVSTALALTADKQFPNWIPHLTLTYENEAPDVSAYQSVAISGVELWLGGEKIAYPFEKPVSEPTFTIEEPTVASAPITAAVGKFDPSLHPRGADGRFIEKFGIIKFLSPKGTWNYGKVEGIEKDQTGTVKVTVTPSTLSGTKLSGEPKDLLPKQIYHAPKPKAHLTTKAIGAQKIGGQGGSNPGGLYSIPKPKAEDPDNLAADKYYVKTPKSKSHGANEALANDLYAEAGVPVPEVDLHSDGQLYSKIVEGQQDMAQQLNNPEWTDQIRRNFAVDAWLGNRDVFGMTYDNVLTDANGTAWRIDNGGALLYRAMGEKKTDFGSKVTELDAFRQGKKAKIFGPGMSKDQELDGAARVLAILPQRIDEMVAEAGLPKSLADTLKARRAYIADYYGLELPEASKPAGAQEDTTAPLVDAADLAKHGGKGREWFKAPLHQAALLLTTGDTIEVKSTSGTGSTDQLKYGIDHFGHPLSGLGAQAQVLGWQNTYGADAEIMFKKAAPLSNLPRPVHGAKLAGTDLSGQNWQRGDKLIGESGTAWTVKGANHHNGAVLLEGPNGTLLLDTHGKDGSGTWEIQRWDPPVVPVEQIKTDDELTSFKLAPETGKYEQAMPSQEDSLSAVDTVIAKHEAEGSKIETLAEPKEKTGQAAEAEAKIKADLDQPLPTGNGTPEPKKTSAKSGEKKMLIGDGTEATPGASLVSKKDGKTYTFVKPKGQYAVVTDPNGEDPEKQLLKLASTMTQPGAEAVADPDAIEAPKTATGEVPQLGMMATAKDGWTGEIKMISPDGKFVFIYDANGKKKRKSTGTVSIISAPQAVADAPKKTPGPIKDYGTAPGDSWKGEEKASHYSPDAGAMFANEMVHVGYADGTSGLEPYSGQPWESLEQNSQGAVVSYGKMSDYLGPISSDQLIQAAEADNKGHVYQVVYSGNIFFTDGTTGPNGGLVLWYADDYDANKPGDDAWEVNPGGPVTLNVIATEVADFPMPLPEGSSFQTADEYGPMDAGLPLYGEEAKTLAQWKGQIAEGQEISLDGKNWMTVKSVNPGGSLVVGTNNGSEVFLNAWSNATYVLKAPSLKDGDAQSSAWTPEVTPATDVTDQPDAPSFGGYTPVPGDTIKKFGDDDTAGSFYVQKEPGGNWFFLKDDGTLSGSSTTDEVMQGYEKEAGKDLTVWPQGGATGTPSFTGYTPQPGEQVFEEPNGSHWVLTPADGKYHAVNDDGTLAQSFAMTQTEWDLAAQSTPSPQVWPQSGETGVPWIDTPAKKKASELVAGDVVKDYDGNVTVIQHIGDSEFAGGVTLHTYGGPTEGEYAPGATDLEYLGNAADGFVNLKLADHVQHFYPGVQIEVAEGQVLTVLTYPSMQNDGSRLFAVMTNGNPSDIELVSTHSFGENVELPTLYGPGIVASEVGVDTHQVDALFDAHATLSKPKPDHHTAMTNAGIPFGKAQYPIFVDGKGSYFRNGPTGLEWWNDIDGTWTTSPAGGTAAGMEKVWDGVPFEGELNVPADADLSLFGVETATYKPKPGEAVAITTMSTGASALAVSPSGSFADGQMVHTIMFKDGKVHLSEKSYTAESLKMGDATVTVLHDPFAENAPDASPIVHHEGPEMPTVLADQLGALGHEPKPGASYFVAVDKSSSFTGVYTTNASGQYQYIGKDGQLTGNEWSLQAITDSFADVGSVDAWDMFTWTDGTAEQKPVPNLPSGYAPFTPSEGQSVLKITTPAGKQTVLVQQHPGAGWYVMDADGTINESSDAVKSDYVVQKYLSGQGNAKAGTKYELLHPAAPGADTDGKPGDLPSFKGYQVKPGEKVYKLGGPDDPDPWFYVQTEPGGMWTRILTDEDGEGYLAAPGEVSMATTSDASVQKWLEEGDEGFNLVWDGSAAPSVDTGAAAGAPTFDGYTPKPGEKVVGETNDYWVQKEPGGDWSWIVKNGPTAGQLQTTGTVSDSSMQSYIANGTSPVVWDGGKDGGAEAVVFKAPGATNGYTPLPTDTVWKDEEGDHWVQQEPGGKWYLVKDDGQLSKTGMADGAMQAAEDEYKPVWPDTTPIAPADQGVLVKGYQTKKSDNVVDLVYVNGETSGPLVWSPEHAQWLPVQDGGTLGNPTEDGFTQDTVDWFLSQPDTKVNVLQGFPKGTPAGDAAPLSEDKYAGVAQTTNIDVTAINFGGYAATTLSKEKVGDLGTLEQGQSIWVIEPGGSTSGVESVWLRKSDGTWSRVDEGGVVADSGFLSDAEFENWASGYDHIPHKLQFGAPTAPPVVKKPYDGPTISGWSVAGVPNPATFNAITDPSQAKGSKAGSFIFMTANGTGLMMQLGKDWDGGENFYPSKVWAVNGNVVVENPAISYEDMDQVSPWKWVPGNQFYISGDPAPTTPSGGIGDLYNKLTAKAPSAPQEAPAAPAPKPSYPGALAPSQEDINAWGGSLTKDGHIPTAGMFVTGKGPMSGKIISVSKDKTKAVVLTSEGKKTTRLIEALKTDKSANYSAYAAPATLKDVPQGMPLAVDTVAEALDKTAKDGKFRAILNGHPGVSQGQMVVTKTTAPSGKVFNRVHFTLTPAQREQLVAMLSGTGEKGDWVTSSKMSEAVAIGDELPMRKSSTDNPDGTPRWKVDSSIKPPTHSVVKVEDDPSGSGVKIVTLKDKNTGELITSRFHPGKSLTTYTWDPNKPKAMTAGAFSLSEGAKAMGWSKVNDGGISAIKGGADSGTLYHEPGSAVSKGAFQDAGHSWETLRNVSDDGVVIELIEPKGNSKYSTTGTTVISVPQGVDEKALGAALAKLGVDYRPMSQDDAKTAVRGTLRTLLNLDISDVDTAKGWTDEKLFAQAGQSMGLSDLGWHDVLVGVDETTGKTSFFWSDRARNAIAAKTKYNLVYRSATTGDANAIVSTVKYGSANSVLKRTTGMIDTPTGKGTGASWSSDQSNHAGHGSYSSASNKSSLPTSNSQAGYKGVGMMVFSRPEAVLGRIADFRVANSDAFGMGQGSGADHLKHAMNMPSVKDFFIGGGLPTEAVGYIAVVNKTARTQAIEKLKADGFAMINGRPIEEVIITMDEASKLKPSDLPPVTLPSNARPILDLPTSYDTPAAAPAGEAA